MELKQSLQELKVTILARAWSLLALPSRAETVAHSMTLKVSARPSIKSGDRRVNGNPDQGLVSVRPRLLEEARGQCQDGKRNPSRNSRTSPHPHSTTPSLTRQQTESAAEKCQLPRPKRRERVPVDNVWHWLRFVGRNFKSISGHPSTCTVFFLRSHPPLCLLCVIGWVLVILCSSRLS
ncbi:hypothetical protein NL676_004566 [Syzygium grande]|nr:hypothetical protein NL676_004566 [Syzygium grande]